MEYLCIEEYENTMGLKFKNILICSDRSLLNYAIGTDKDYHKNFDVSEFMETNTKFRNNLAKN